MVHQYKSSAVGGIGAAVDKASYGGKRVLHSTVCSLLYVCRPVLLLSFSASTFIRQSSSLRADNKNSISVYRILEASNTHTLLSLKCSDQENRGNIVIPMNNDDR